MVRSAAMVNSTVSGSSYLVNVLRVILTRRFHSLIDVLVKSPVLTNWGWSSLVKHAFEKNIHLFISEPQSLFDSATRIVKSRYSAGSVTSKFTNPHSLS